MGTEMLSYSQLGDRLNCSPEAARSALKAWFADRDLPGDRRSALYVR